MRLRVVSHPVRLPPVALLFLLWAIPAGTLVSLAGARPAAAQIRAIASPSAHPSTPRAHPDALLSSTTNLFLCVDNSTIYPCPTPITSDNTYISNITMTYGQTLDGVGEAIGPTSGIISFIENGNTFCQLEIGGNQSCNQAYVPSNAGPYVITAEFLGNSEFAPSISQPVDVTILPETTTATLTTSEAPAVQGTPVTFTARITGPYTVPTGLVTFSNGSAPIGTAPVDPTGTAQLTTSTLPVGTHTITATYAASQNFLGSSATVSQVITPSTPPVATLTTLISSVNPSEVGQNVTFTATVGAAQPGTSLTELAGGTVTFRDGQTILGTTALNTAGTAAYSTATLIAGTHAITATYNGNAPTAASVSSPLIQQVEYPVAMAPPGYTITVTPASVATIAGATQTLTVTVTALGGYSEPVTLGCTGLPNEAACTFQEQAIPAGGGITTLSLSTAAPHPCSVAAMSAPGAPPGILSLRFPTPLLAGLLLLLAPRRIRPRKMLTRLALGLILLTGMLNLNACSSPCTDFATQPGSYTFRVTGTASINVATSVGMQVNP